VFDWLKRLFQNESQRVAELEAEIRRLGEDLDAESLHALELEDEIQGLNEAIGLLYRRNEGNIRAGNNTIGWLVTMLGGEVSVNRDLIAAVEQGESYLHFQDSEEGVTISLLTPEQYADLMAKQQAEVK
jgi:hypothetical protein